MLIRDFDYEEPLFRPPSEARSVILQATIGCSWNKCAFCEMYTSKTFRVKKPEQIEKDIKELASVSPDARKIFIADGNAMVMSYRRLKEILELLHQHFPKIQRISAYALPGDILSKTDTELRLLKELGLKLLYVGIESGDDELLNLINKGEDFESTRKGLIKARNNNIKLSVMILNGLGGKVYSRQHAEHSAKLINAIQPEYLSTLVLSFPWGENHYKKRFHGDYIPLGKLGLLNEMKAFIEKLVLKESIFRSDHASNYLVLKGILNRDKEVLLEKIQCVLDHPEKINLREEWQRGL